MNGAVDPRRRVPRTDTLLADPRLAAAEAILGRARVKVLVSNAQDRARRGEILPEDVLAVALAALPETAAGLRPVLNATGVVLHTNLGRAPLSGAAISAVVAAAGHTDVELDLRTGRRARRGRTAMAALAEAVPAAGAVHVVNNGAAALALAATAITAPGTGADGGGGGGREIVVSRGELVEIGDGFRLPDLLASTGARLREVGTTNRSTLVDYAAAIGPQTAFVLKVHPSNFVVRGFTAAVPVEELATLGVPVVVDIGSGLLAPDPLLPHEPDAASALRAGATLVTASGDKLLGGPQAGLLLGDADLVERLRRHPLARALRVDKLTLAALEATLSGPETPTWRALRATPGALRIRTERLRDHLAAAGLKTEVLAADAVVGGGGAPEVTLESWALTLPEEYAEPLRHGDPPILGRLERGRLLLDLRCVPAEHDEAVRAAVLRVPRPWQED
ncbi:L-seryl-tRNA(Sec) selenium transferase [Plantactinospora sp. S1510]|uniref:L-seryl-tRNA(Sec) selenium transferase n=1 Tax=Plantactinospora alkalitolerans TaxID=2789879 RepID=A0ABS0GQW6_9ACTN|nr:L-seryl-tRNA(Sec) selenium transferase [Plantactinospora alkalitolerans]MBF9128582.1 L-seryl-tRNA(Sec) selenium transferase [Plantactinospora alkalitolerans]